MTEQKHTAGPWYIDTDNAEGIANAALIAAAPLMYATLDRLLHDGDLDDRDAAHLIMHTLITARGE